MNAPDPKANTTTEAYLAYKAGYLEESELKPVLYEPYLHFDAWLAYWAGLTTDYPVTISKKNLFDISKVKTNSTTLVNNGDGTLTVNTPAGSSSVGSAPPNKLSDFCPDLKVGDTATLSLKTTGTEKYIYLYGTGANVGWASGVSRTITQAMLDAQVLWYASGVNTSATISNVQLELGTTSSEYEPYSTPEMLTDEEALVAYLAGVTDTYPEDIKDPYDVRIVGYLKHLASIRWPEPDYPVNNEEFYLSTMEPTHTSNSEPSADIELDTAEGKVLSVEAYGDTYQQTYTGKNLMPLASYDTSVERYTWVPTLNLPAGTYNISFDITSITLGTNTSFDLRLSFRDSDGVGHNIVMATINARTSLTRVNKTFTISYDAVQDARSNIGIVQTAYDAGGRVAVENIQIEAGSEETAYEPYTGKIPSPNPDYPQTVSVVTGTQTVTVTGKNLFDRANAEENKLLAWATGLTLDETGSLVSDYIPVTPTEELKFTYNAQVLFYGASKNYIGALLQADGSAIAPIGSGGGNFNKITVPNLSDIAYMRLGFRAPYSSSVNLLTANIQVERGTVATTYEPYQGQSYEVDLAGDNLFDISKVISNSTSLVNNGDGTLTVTAYGTYAASPNTLSAFCPTLQAGDEVVLIADTTSSNKFVYLAGTNTRWNFGEKRTILASDLTSGVLWYSDNASTSATISNIKVAKPIELCKIDNYQDYIYKSGDDWYIHKETGKTIVTGDSSEDWIAQTTNIGYMYRITLADVGSVPAGDKANLVSDYFTPTTSGVIYNVTSGGYIAQLTTPGYIRFSIGDTTNKLSEFRTWLGTHNTTVYYALATPTDTKITDSTLIGQLDALAGADTYNGKTYIMVVANDPNLPALLKIEAYKY